MSITSTAVDPTVPPDAVPLVPAAPGTVPLRNPEGTWAFVITTVGLTTHGRGHGPTAPSPDPAHTDAASLFAGAWLPGPPPATLNRGDVVVQLFPHADLNPTRVDVEVLAAHADEWCSVRTLSGLDARWPHHVATTVLSWMRMLAEQANRALLWRTYGSILEIERATSGLIPNTPDALGTLIDAGLVAVGDHLTWNGHTATVCHSGSLARGTEPRHVSSSAVSTLATSLATPVTVNGWHLWHHLRSGHTLAQLRAELGRDRYPR
ncbi:hypothetical protein ACIA5G_52230 [Amycolatopsis sp. NPDC051758]|uniref:hypothetical protein n=1 Tax=Amycolatopsis sp. NPDC051758 TaxID=3363935 RepID=UPI00378C74CB